MKKRHIIFLLCCLLYLMSYFQRSAPTVISLDLRQSLDVSLADLSLISGVTMLAYGLMQMPAGLITDRVGARRTIIALTSLAVVSAVIFSFVHTLNGALATRFLLGIGISVLVPIMTYICRIYPPGESGRVISLIVAAGALGPLVSATPLAWLSNAVGWRFSLLFFAGVMALILIGFALLGGEKTEPTPAEPEKTAHLKDTWHGAALILKSGRFWPLCLWQMFTSGAIFMLNTLWWGPYLMQGHDLPKVTASVVLLASPLAMLVSQPLFGWLSDVVFRSRKKPMGMASALSVLAALSFVVGKEAQPVPLLIVQTIALTVGLVGATPLLFALVRESFPIHLSGTALGCANMFFPIWAFVLQKLFGVMVDHSLVSGASTMEAYATASWLLVFNAVGAIVMIFLIRDQGVAPRHCVIKPLLQESHS